MTKLFTATLLLFLSISLFADRSYEKKSTLKRVSNYKLESVLTTANGPVSRLDSIIYEKYNGDYLHGLIYKKEEFIYHDDGQIINQSIFFKEDGNWIINKMVDFEYDEERKISKKISYDYRFIDSVLTKENNHYVSYNYEGNKIIGENLYNGYSDFWLSVGYTGYSFGQTVDYWNYIREKNSYSYNYSDQINGSFASEKEEFIYEYNLLIDYFYKRYNYSLPWTLVSSNSYNYYIYTLLKSKVYSEWNADANSFTPKIADIFSYDQPIDSYDSINVKEQLTKIYDSNGLWVNSRIALLNYNYEYTLGNIIAPYFHKKGLNLYVPKSHMMLDSTVYAWDTIQNAWKLSEKATFHYSNEVITGIEDNSDSFDVTVYPNPATDFLYVKGSFETAFLEVFDIQGRKVLSEVIKNTDKVSVKNLNKGIHLFKLTNNERTIIKKIAIE